MPVLGLDTVVIGYTTQQVTRKDDNSILGFTIQEYLGDHEQPGFSLEIPDTDESLRKHVLELEDLSILITTNNQETGQSNSPGGTPVRNTRTTRGTTPRTSRRPHRTLNQMPATILK
ncbi:9737_t:CDS:2 [Diversispora eburnea]|uniref:9737_t:CDS:1 n=1 Tax=Diversispora eburnea TaxID=1213867 RepID=A0A9N9ATD3_9GLOM|nr:9737_t:CDS:2 [Diversispora eburnea]